MTLFETGVFAIGAVMLMIGGLLFVVSCYAFYKMLIGDYDDEE